MAAFRFVEPVGRRDRHGDRVDAPTEEDAGRRPSVARFTARVSSGSNCSRSLSASHSGGELYGFQYEALCAPVL